MGITFASLSRAVHIALQPSAMNTASGTNVQLGHVHQVLSAALGYNTHAALKASIEAGEESPSYDGAKHIILDVPRLTQRVQDLGYPGLAAAFESAVRDGIESLLPEVKFHENASDLGFDIQDEVVDAIENSGGYSSEVAMTNAYGGDFDIEFSAPVPIEFPQPQWTLSVDGTSSLEQDLDKVHHGDVINVTAKVVFPKIGRRVLGEMTIEQAGGSIAMDEPDEMDV